MQALIEVLREMQVNLFQMEVELRRKKRISPLLKDFNELCEKIKCFSDQEKGKAEIENVLHVDFKKGEKVKKGGVLGLLFLLLYSPLFAAEITRTVMTLDPNDSVCGISLPKETKVFNAETDYAAYVFFMADDVKKNDELYVEWLFENKTNATASYVFDENYYDGSCFYSYLILKGTSAEYMEGNWLVRLYINGQYLAADDFYVEGKKHCVISFAAGDQVENIETLHKFRDMLMRFDGGKALVSFYYNFSPYLIEKAAENEGLKKTINYCVSILAPIINKGVCQ